MEPTIEHVAEFITDIAAYWGDRVTWLEIGAVRLLGALPERAAAADQPSAHSVESFFGALFASTRDMGARVALQGDGGDQLFAVSHVFFNDLFARGRWRELRREWMAFGFGQQGFRWFLDMVVRPVLERSIFPARNERKLAIEPAPWVQPALLERERMLEKERAAASELRRHCRSDAALETIGALTHPVLPRVVTAFSLQGMTHGVEMRAPLLDRRIVEFALRRPRSERASLGEVKRLLRAAGRGLLPETVLAPRRARTGMLTGYFRESFLADPDGLIERTFRQPVLADLGIVERDALLRAWHEYRGSRGGTLGAMLFGTLHTELWVRARLSTGVPAHGQA